MTYLIVGASSGLGRALAEEYAANGYDLIITSRETRDLEPLAQHLAVKYSVRARSIALDLAEEELPLAEIDNLLSGLAPLSGILLPAGINDSTDEVGLDAATLRTLTRVNYLAPCELINHYLPLIEKNNGAVTGFGSVAGARGRSRNAAYAAAKRALDSYFESLIHYAINRGFSAQYYALGYMDTNLAFSQDLALPLAKPDKLAKIVFSRRGKLGKRYLPWFWYIPCKIIQWMPTRIFGRLSF